MILLAPHRMASEAGAEIVRTGGERPPRRAVVDSRELTPGDLFVGLPGEKVDGGEFAAAALEAGAWGVLVSPERAASLADPDAGTDNDGWVLSVPDPLRGLQRLARGWRRQLPCRVVGITGSTGKTTVKDMCRAMLPFHSHASPENFNTEIGLPLAILSAPEDTELMILEMAMRGLGQIAELCEIAEPNVAAITNVGPVHLELLGTLEAIAEAKAEILAGLGEDGTAVVPADAEALAPHLDDELRTVTFGVGGDVFALNSSAELASTVASIATPDGEQEFRFPFGEAHNLTNALAAIAVGVALEAPLAEMARRAPEIGFSRLRGELIELPDDVLIVNDCYNANPISMRAALDHLGALGVAGRRLAVLGEMKELGPDAARYHRELGAHARELGIGPIVGVGELARDYSPDEWAPDAAAAAGIVEEMIAPGDAVLVKGSRSVGLETVSDAVVSGRGAVADGERR